MILGIFKTYKDIKRGIKDPAALGQDMALDIIKGPLILFTIASVIFFAALFVLAYTGALGGPYLGFKIVFWLLFLPALFVEAIAWMLISNISKMMDRAREKMNKTDIMEAEVVKGEKDLT